jgi:hypothetical protein
LHRLFEGDFGSGCEEEMDVVGHDDEGVELKAILRTLLLKDFN